MDEVKRLIHYYQTLKTKIEFIRNYFECLDVVFKKSSDVLSRATQLPRDTEWNDTNLLNLVELSAKQKEMFDHASNSYIELFKELNDLENQVNEEILHIETNLSKVIEQEEQKNKELEKAKIAHLESWIMNKDPWITDICLKTAIKNITPPPYNYKENNDFVISGMKSMYTDKFLNIQDLYTQLLNKFCKEQKVLYSDLSEISHLKFSISHNTEKYYDVSSENGKEVNESKIINAYEEIMQNMNIDLSKKDINIYKNIEPIKYGMYKIKRGLTREWSIVFVSVTRSKFIHFFQIFNLNKICQKYSNLLNKLQNSNNKSIVSIFDSKKNLLNEFDEKNLLLLGDEIRDNIDKLINSLIITINLKDKIINLEKDKKLITVNEKEQNGISSLFGLNELKIKSFTLSSCYELYFSMKKNLEPEKSNITENEEISAPLEISKNIVVKIEEENPWTK
ncbi:coiled-coil Arf-GAP ANK repeat and PH domain-containing protein [Vairimorpha necatrix]|uniref:Coiled-coil Arf-GAP ANK repeat and PH domain-containing protein n=1 Tax=Vairimorpha necatrix TaxID=6039 RepID=A0AAX4JD68_9MICR